MSRTETTEHLDDAELRRFFGGESPEAEAARVVAHLATRCGDCRAEARRHWPPARTSPGGSSRGSSRGGQRSAERAYGEAFGRVVERAVARGDEIEVERAAAADAVDELLALPAARRAAHLDAETALHTPAALDRLLGHVRAAGFRDPAEYLELAELAHRLARRLPAERYGAALVADLEARALCHLANASKVSGDLDAAEQRFAEAERLLERGSGDPFRRARLETLRASLRAVERRYEEAERGMRRAIRIYRRLGEPVWVARAEIDRAIYRRKAGRTAEAIEGLEAVLDGLDAGEQWRLARVVHHSLALAHLDSGDLVRSRAHLAEARRLHEREPQELALVRLEWAEARLARASGDARAAEASLVAVRDFFLERGIAHEVANAGLDLAAIYLDEGRWEELAETAAMMLEVYRTKRIGREAVAALGLFQRAVAARAVTAELVAQLRNYLEWAETHPGERFVPRGAAAEAIDGRNGAGSSSE